MPRKNNNTPEVKALLRKNQRRARARQKGLVEDLQRRLQDYEKAGVQATIAMQAAARTVAAENKALRVLLAQRGVTDVEIDQFLALDGTTQSPPTASTLMSMTTHDSHGADVPNVTADVDVSNHPSQPPSSASPTPPRTHMHCDIAAGIVADVHGHGDMDLARTTLGCTTADCSVKTTQVFTIIDNAT